MNKLRCVPKYVVILYYCYLLIILILSRTQLLFSSVYDYYYYVLNMCVYHIIQHAIMKYLNCIKIS